MPDQTAGGNLAVEIGYGPLVIRTNASVPQVSELILLLVKGYGGGDLPKISTS